MENRKGGKKGVKGEGGVKIKGLERVVGDRGGVG